MFFFSFSLFLQRLRVHTVCVRVAEVIERNMRKQKRLRCPIFDLCVAAECGGRWEVAANQQTSFLVQLNCTPFQHYFAFQ